MKRYSKIKIERNINENVGTLGARYYKNVSYPTIPESENDIWVITEFGDRLDLLANQFYNDVGLYWVIAAANPDYVNFGSLYITEGTQIRIPTDLNNIISSFNQLNQS